MVNRRVHGSLAALSVAALLLAACSSTTSGRDADPARSVAASAARTPSGGGSTESATSCTYVPTGDAARPVTPPPVHPVVYATLTLAMTAGGSLAGPISIALRDAAAPCTVGSIVHLAQSKFYDATRCHRLTTSGIFVLQCGDPTATGMGGPGYAFPDELTGNETYPAGTVAMANNGPDTNGSQFFLVYRASQLPPNYTVFGTITGGMKLLDSIAAAGTKDPAGDGTPKNPVVIETATVS